MSAPVKHPHLAAVVTLGAALLLPVVELIDDLTRWERIYLALRVVITVVSLVVLVAALAACVPGQAVTSTATVESAVVVR